MNKKISLLVTVTLLVAGTASAMHDGVPCTPPQPGRRRQRRVYPATPLSQVWTQRTVKEFKLPEAPKKKVRSIRLQRHGQ